MSLRTEERSYFERERDRLISEISENLARLTSNTNVLNRNIEQVTQIGTHFEDVHSLWSQFAKVMAGNPTPSNGTSSGERRQRTESGVAMDSGEGAGDDRVGAGTTTSQGSQQVELGSSTLNLPPGVAPGGGRHFGEP